MPCNLLYRAGGFLCWNVVQANWLSIQFNIHFAAVFLFLLGWDVVVVLHHFISVVANVVVLYRGTNGTEMMATLLGTEITNPLMQIRFFLRYDRASAGDPVNMFFRRVVEWSFFVLFTVMRIILGSVFVHRYMSHPRPDWVAQFLVCSIYLISWVFWVNIVLYAYRKYFSWWLFGQNENGSVVKPATNENGMEK